MLDDFPAFILHSTFQWLQFSDAFRDKTLVFQLLLPKFNYWGLNFPSEHLRQSRFWGENISQNVSCVSQNELMEHRDVLSTFRGKKKRILAVSQRNTNVSIQQSETLEIAGGERSLQVQSHKKEITAAGEAERRPGRFLHHSKQRSAVRQTHSQDKPSTPPGTWSASSLEQSLDPRWMEQSHVSVCASARLFPLMLGLSTGFFAGQMQRSQVWRALRRYFQAG